MEKQLLALSALYSILLSASGSENPDQPSPCQETPQTPGGDSAPSSGPASGFEQICPQGL